MVDEGVVEAVLDGGGELFKVFLVERQRRDDLFVEHFVHEALHVLVVHAVAHDVEAREVGSEDEAGVRAVQDAYLALLVGRHVGDYDAVEAGLLKGELLFEPRGAFDVPDAEDFADVDELVVVAVLFVEARSIRGVFDAARDYAVDERRAEGAFAAPFREVVLKPPLLDVLLHALLKLLAVVVDELAGEDDDGLFAGLPALVEHLRQLRGEGRRRAVLFAACGVVYYAGFGGVRDDVLEVVRDRDFHHRVVVRLLIGVEAAADRRYDALTVDLLAVFASAQVERVEPLLLVYLLRESRRYRLHEDGFAVPARALVGHVEPVVDEGAQEVALSELENFLRRVLEYVALVAGAFQNVIIESFHDFHLSKLKARHGGNFAMPLP